MLYGRHIFVKALLPEFRAHGTGRKNHCSCSEPHVFTTRYLVLKKIEPWMIISMNLDVLVLC